MDKSDRVAQAAAINGDRIESVLTMMAGKVVHASEPFVTLKDK